MKHTDVRPLNQRFAEAFGRPNGAEPKYKWCLTSSLMYFLKDDTTLQQTPSGLYVVLPTFKRKTWADRYGEAWVIAQWKAPEMTADKWLEVHGTTIPYPANGRYLPIEATILPNDVEPSDDLTVYAISLIRQQMETTYAEHVTQAREAAEKDIADKKQEWADLVDSQWPAFDSVPGMKLHTSFPTPQSKIIHTTAE